MLEPRLTWNPAGPAPYESAWSVLVKVQSLNLFHESEMRSLLLPGVLAREWDQALLSSESWDLERFALLLEVDVYRLNTAFLDRLGFSRNRQIPYRVRHCPECRKLGYHCTLFNLDIVINCPWHRVALMRGCRKCAKMVLTSGRESAVDRELHCTDCGCYCDLKNSPQTNRVDHETARDIEHYCAEFVMWWRSVLDAAGRLSPLVRPLASNDKKQMSERRPWRLGWADHLSRVPHGWKFACPITPALVHAPIPMRQRHLIKKYSATQIEGYRTLYGAVRRAVYKAYLRPHIKCLREISGMGTFERLALDIENACTVSIGYLSWRAAHEGLPRPDHPSAPPQQLAHLRPAVFEELWPCDEEAISVLLYSNFLRIWADIEQLVETTAVRIVHTKGPVAPCDLPFAESLDDAHSSVSFFIPCGDELAARTTHRCMQRRDRRGLMCNPAAVYANAGWNAVPDPQVLQRRTICQSFAIDLLWAPTNVSNSGLHEADDEVGQSDYEKRILMGTLHPWKRRVFIDTEFTNIESPALVSLALVAEDGDEFYAELADFDTNRCSDFVRTFVLPQLGQYPSRVMQAWDVAKELDAWMEKLKQLRERPVLCYDHPFDIELLIGLMGKKPTGWQFQNIAMHINPSKREQYFAVYGGRHHALSDARANRSSFQ
ncbi:conserved hypothetical protein [Ricinus communis]|uniref:Uncharacterized protein n=1 Tax=Ricinus communis TaxID=3988 RepID=B9T9K6_RICCO|nr:conserved hypothetical protein [Ricinus communis]